MLRSLSTSVSGMKNHQTLLDVISNNIANVNTVGYKASRVVFENAMTQTLEGAVRPDEAGGKNPMQVGLGLGLGSIDTLMKQGNVQTTGNTTDLAIQGESFFAVSNGNQVYYTRDGSFNIDASGAMVHSISGCILQGKMTNTDGEIEPGTNVGNIVIPYSAQSPARATTEVSVSQNLDSDSEALGTVIHSQSFFAVATDGSGNGVRNTDDALVNLFNSGGDPLEILEGETLTIGFSLADPTTGVVSEEFRTEVEITGLDSVNPASTIGNLMQNIEDAINASGSNATVTLNPDGTVNVLNNDGSGRNIKNLQITSNGLASKATVSDVFKFPVSIEAGESGKSKALRAPATSDDTISSLYTNNGKEMGFEGSDSIQINGCVGDNNIPEPVMTEVGVSPVLGGTKVKNGTGLNYTANTKTVTSATGNFITQGVTAGDIIEIDGVGSFTVESVESETSLILTKAPTTSGGASFNIGGATMSDLMDSIRDALSLAPKDDGVNPKDSVSMNAGGTDDKIADGALVIRGKSGSAFSLEKVTLKGIDGAKDNDPSPVNFTANMAMVEYQEARDYGEFDTSIEVFDETGDSHTVILTFTNTGKNGEWAWEASLAGQEEIVSGNRGSVFFNADGTPASWTFQDQSTSFIFDPANGSERLDISFDFGKPGETGGLTQFNSDTTVTISDQDGYTTGRLDEISVNSVGEVLGSFTNGTNRTLAQIYLASFTNPAGMVRTGENMFTESNNSGPAKMGVAGKSDTSTITSGALEGGNVDLAQEFTNMIVTQRGYQATSRVVSTSDQLLQELVNLSR